MPSIRTTLTPEQNKRITSHAAGLPGAHEGQSGPCDVISEERHDDDSFCRAHFGSDCIKAGAHPDQRENSRLSYGGSIGLTHRIA